MSFQTRKTFVLGPADVEHTYAAPCLRAEECTRMRRGALMNAGGDWLEDEEIVV